MGEIATVANKWEPQYLATTANGELVAEKRDEIKNHMSCYALGALYGCAYCYHGCVTTQRLRKRFGMAEGNKCLDCLKHFFCTECALTAEHKFIRTKFRAQGWGQLTGFSEFSAGPSRQSMAQPS